MGERRQDILEELRQQLESLELAAANIRTTINDLVEEERQRTAEPGTPRAVAAAQNQPIRVLDRDGSAIRIGYTVSFLTRGRFSSTTGVVTRFSRNGGRVFSQDPEGNEVARAPRNLRVLGVQLE